MKEMRSRWFAHVDMDSFYASVEVLDRPELAGFPVAVGGAADRRGVIAAASYPAREFGVRSAMPTARALQLCPQLILLSGRMPRYVEISRQVMEILRSTAPAVEPLSLDEAALDLAGCDRLYGIREDATREGWSRFASELQQRILDDTGLWASIGLGETRRIAKIASDLNKPRGLVVVPAGDGPAFLAQLPVSRIGGVGPRFAARLEAAGLQRAGDVAQLSRAALQARFGKQGAHLHDIVNARDFGRVNPDRGHKSISHEVTFATDRLGLDQLEGPLLRHCERVGSRLRQAHLQGRVVQLKIRDQGFATFTRQLTLPRPTDSDATIHRAALRLLHELGWERVPVHLLGVGLHDLSACTGRQADLFDDSQDRQERAIDRVMDRVQERFGTDSLGHARSVLETTVHKSSGPVWPLAMDRQGPGPSLPEMRSV
jgi:DNA polymerase-4